MSKKYEFNVSIVGGPNLTDRYFEGKIISGQYKGRAIDLPFVGARKMDFGDPLDPFVTEVETRWSLCPNDEIIASVTPEDLEGNPIVSFSWGPATSVIGKELPLGKKSAAPVNSAKGQAPRKVGTIYLPDYSLRKSPLGQVSVIEISTGRQAWCGPIDPNKFPSALDDSTKYRYFAWTVSREGVISKVEICNPLDVKIKITSSAVPTKAPATPAKVVVNVAPVVVPVAVAPAPAKVENKPTPVVVEITDDPAPKKKAIKGKRRQKRLTAAETELLVADVVKNSGPKPAPAPTTSLKAKAVKAVSPKPETVVNPTFKQTDSKRYRAMGPNRKQLDMGKLADMARRAADLLFKKEATPTLADNVILEQEQGPGTGFFVRCERNVLKDGVQPLIDAMAQAALEEAEEAKKLETTGLEVTVLTPLPATATLATA